MTKPADAFAAMSGMFSSTFTDDMTRLGQASFATLFKSSTVCPNRSKAAVLARGMSPPGSGLDAKTFFIVPLVDITIFAAFVWFAYRDRFDPAAHKRLILLATIALMDAPTGRPPFAVLTNHAFIDCMFCWLFVLMMVGYDLWSSGKVHRVILWGV